MAAAHLTTTRFTRRLAASQFGPGPHRDRPGAREAVPSNCHSLRWGAGIGQQHRSELTGKSYFPSDFNILLWSEPLKVDTERAMD